MLCHCSLLTVVLGRSRVVSEASPFSRSSVASRRPGPPDHGNATSGAKVTAGSGVNLLIKIINIVALLVLVPLL